MKRPTTRKHCARLIGITASLAVAFTGCEQRAAEPKRSPGHSPSPGQPAPTSPLTVYTTFYPSQYFASRIAGDAAIVTCPLPPDADPIFWQPSREEIRLYQQADLILINGADFEKWVATASLPDSRALDLSQPFADRFITFQTVTHQHGSGGAHTHEGIDGHTWIDPVNAKIQAKSITHALRQRLPDRAADFEKRAAELEHDLDVLDARFKALAPAAAEILLIASHPAYNYADQRYALGIINVALDPEAEPTNADLAAIDQALRTRPASKKRILLWESDPIEAAVRTIGARVDAHVVFSPCEVHDPADAAANVDYFQRMKQNLDALERALPPRGQ